MQLDSAGGLPLYLQVAEYVRNQCLNGRWRPGDRVATVRDLALALGINPNTVAKAYTLLQEQGVLESRPGGGTFAAVRASHEVDSERNRLLEREFEALLRRAEQLGITHEEILHKWTSYMQKRGGK